MDGTFSVFTSWHSRTWILRHRDSVWTGHECWERPHLKKINRAWFTKSHMLVIWTLWCFTYTQKTPTKTVFPSGCSMLATATIAWKYIGCIVKQRSSPFFFFFVREVVQINLAERFSGLVRHTAEHNAVMLDLTATAIRHSQRHLACHSSHDRHKGAS